MRSSAEWVRDGADFCADTILETKKVESTKAAGTVEHLVTHFEGRRALHAGPRVVVLARLKRLKKTDKLRVIFAIWLHFLLFLSLPFLACGVVSQLGLLVSLGSGSVPSSPVSVSSFLPFQLLWLSLLPPTLFFWPSSRDQSGHYLEVSRVPLSRLLHASSLLFLGGQNSSRVSDSR